MLGVAFADPSTARRCVLGTTPALGRDHAEEGLQFWVFGNVEPNTGVDKELEYGVSA